VLAKFPNRPFYVHPAVQNRLVPLVPPSRSPAAESRELLGAIILAPLHLRDDISPSRSSFSLSD
jgi:hypothetical protein